MYCRILSC